MPEYLFEVVYHIVACCRGIPHHEINRVQPCYLLDDAVIHIAVKAAVYQAVIRLKTHIGADKIRHQKRCIALKFCSSSQYTLMCVIYGQHRKYF